MSYDDLDDLLQANETLREEIAAKNIEISAITSQLAEARKQLINDGSTHYEGCFAGGSKHYQCALGEIKRLTEQLAEARRTQGTGIKDYDNEAEVRNKAFVAGFHAGAAKGARALYERLYKEMEYYGCTGCEEDPPMVALAHIKKVVEEEFSLPPSPKREGE